MNRFLKIGFFVAGLMVFFTAAYAIQQPLEAIKGPVDQVLHVLQDPQYSAADKQAELRDKIWTITRPMFDFELIAKRSVGRYHWTNTFSATQRTEFVDLFSRFMGNTYLQRIKGNVSDIRIEYTEQQISETKPLARVKSIVSHSNVEVELDYKLRLRDGTWKIYDLYAAGVSLTQNYKTQFEKILMNETADQLIERLRQKIAEQQGNPSTDNLTNAQP